MTKQEAAKLTYSDHPLSYSLKLTKATMQPARPTIPAQKENIHL